MRKIYQVIQITSDSLKIKDVIQDTQHIVYVTNVLPKGRLFVGVLTKYGGVISVVYCTDIAAHQLLKQYTQKTEFISRYGNWPQLTQCSIEEFVKNVLNKSISYDSSEFKTMREQLIQDQTSIRTLTVRLSLKEGWFHKLNLLLQNFQSVTYLSGILFQIKYKYTPIINPVNSKQIIKEITNITGGTALEVKSK